jgi:protein-disulfide isomerase
MNRMTTNNKIAFAVTGAMFLAILAFLVVLTVQAEQARGGGDRQTNTADRTPVSVIDDTSHRLDQGEPGSGVTVVEFLDFECEACGAMYPVVEDARERYAGDITFAIRYFPLPGHFNSTNAAIAAEAAARQDKLEQMYTRLFETQHEWGELQESRAPLFRQYADELGLDMSQYDADVADPAVAARVKKDFDAAMDLGLTSTPSFFVNDELVELTAYEDLGLAIDEAVAR